jgi:hypothetical protein
MVNIAHFEVRSRSRLCKNAAPHSEAALGLTVTDTNATISEYFAVLRLASTSLRLTRNVGWPSVLPLSSLPAPHARMAASNGLTPTMFSTRVRL